jgi:hypothetical protein
MEVNNDMRYASRHGFKVLPLLPDLGHQGYDNPLHAAMRRLLGIHNFTVQDPLVFHQFHENSWHGTGEEAVSEVIQLLDQYKKERGL